MNNANVEQVVVVGAGPAGLAATTELVNAGAKVLLIDAGERHGGQYWRHNAGSPFANKHEEMRIVAHPNVDYLAKTNVWAATYCEGVSTLHLLTDRKEMREVNTRALVLATGAYDRSLPFPGWDLPGVMTAGGVQALLKGQKTLAGKKFVVAGTGPLLLPVAVGLIMAGAQVQAIVEASLPTAWSTKLRALIYSRNKLRDFGTFQKIIFKAKVKVHYGSAIIAAHGSDGVERVTMTKIDRKFRIKPNSKIDIDCDVLAVGWGFTPDLSLATALGCNTRIEPRDSSLVVEVDDHQATSLPGVYAAGEVTGVGGSTLALAEGRIAAINLMLASGQPGSSTDNATLKKLSEERKKHQIFANALLEIYRVADGWTTWQADSTILCRCEEVSVGDLRKAIVELGVTDSKSAKSLTRIGMGMCQGRMCGQAVTEFVAKECNRKVTLKDLQGGAKRPVITPIPLGLFAEGPSGVSRTKG
ncbi:hydrogen cyanide synthase subunit HcnB [mine drainage metagenome]|uniref:Hydrogen cyanide synthase subunit HcnB n=1 Tax=mine drainage metagenome TaxID=410659 RepID=A0A1J5QFC6_9ZZZZ